MTEAAGDPWVRWSWIAGNAGEIGQALREHVLLTVAAVTLGFAIAVPLALAVRRWRWLGGPALSVTGLLYTVPALAAFGFLFPYTGFSRLTALIPLVTYTLFILLKNTLDGLASVPADVRDAADGLGFTPLRRFTHVELPLALPTIIAGVRLATVTTVGLITVTALIGQQSLGLLINTALQRDFRTPLVVGLVLSLVLALVADLLLVALQRLLTPWTRAGR